MAMAMETAAAGNGTNETEALHALALTRALDATLRSLIAQVGEALAAQRRALVLHNAKRGAEAGPSVARPALLYTKQLKEQAERYNGLVRELKYWIVSYVSHHVLRTIMLTFRDRRLLEKRSKRSWRVQSYVRPKRR